MATTEVRIPDDFWDRARGEEASLINWLVAEGGRVQAEQEIAEIMFEKSTMIVSAPAAGTLHIEMPVDSVVRLGDVIARIEG
jgi:pyruvate/2-oxoglutarate dehydrogenase complex dihydrolipoamide acyltransferase (E2) component